MERDWLRLPVVSAGAEYLVMGYLMRRNILTYKAPPNNEGYDLICIHPNPRHTPSHGELAQVRVQVKSRYATDCDRGFPVKETSFGAFDFLIVVFLNIGKFYGKNDGLAGARAQVLYLAQCLYSAIPSCDLVVAESTPETSGKRDHALRRRSRF